MPPLGKSKAESIIKNNKKQAEMTKIKDSVLNDIENQKQNKPLESSKIEQVIGRYDFNICDEEVKAAVNYDEEHLRRMATDGIIDYTPDAISMTSEGSPFVRNVVAILDPLMLNTTKKFSKPI